MKTINSRSDLQSGRKLSLLELAELGYWFDKRQVELWIFGTDFKRHRKTEILLERATARKKKGLFAKREGNKLIYTLRKRVNGLTPYEIQEIDPYHDLHCMELFVKFKVTNPSCEPIASKRFKGCGSEPDGGLLYEDNTLILFEFSTRSNTEAQLHGKIRAYKRNLEKIEKRFNAEAIVIFVLEIEREWVKSKVERLEVEGPYRFIDYLSFLDAENAFDAPYIYPDGSVKPL